MSGQWHSTSFPGVRFREHTSRKHKNHRDRYYVLRYMLNGKRIEEPLGWSSQGWNPKKASIELAKLREAHITGVGPETLREKREVAAEKKRQALEIKLQAEKDAVTFGDFFTNRYYPTSKLHRKKSSYEKDMQHFTRWLKPVIGAMPLKDIRPLHLEKVKKNLIEAKKSSRTVEYILATFRQTWNVALRDGLVSVTSPSKQVRFRKTDNRRLRFLSRNEAESLLGDLEQRDIQVHNMALLSLYTGMRASEVFSLTWGDVDLQRLSLIVKDPKGIRNRVTYMNDRVSEMFRKMKPANHDDLVFPDKQGSRYREIPYTFRVAVKDLNLNRNIGDRRQRVCFHTLRHTFASWLVEGGVDLYSVKELLGHGTITMTERYSHLGQNTLQSAIKVLDKRNNELERENVRYQEEQTIKDTIYGSK